LAFVRGHWADDPIHRTALDSRWKRLLLKVVPVLLLDFAGIEQNNQRIAMRVPYQLLVDNRPGFRNLWIGSTAGKATAVSDEEAVERILRYPPIDVKIGEISERMLRELGYLQYKHPEIRFYLLQSKEGAHREAEARRWGITILAREKMFDAPAKPSLWN
jgi:hypothetical protein